ncbi:hypothetical protein C8R43DRAFT_994509 [Mycena crocata]|nr:hypothetical protein C8R43DRAFT_994509 [Mycena crocata]
MARIMADISAHSELVQNGVDFTADDRLGEAAHSPPESDPIPSNIPGQVEEKEGATFNAGESTPRRGRGRPRKDAPPVPPRPPRKPVDPNAPSPRRGERPRKVVIPEVKEEKPERPRGRPRKIVDPDAPVIPKRSRKVRSNGDQQIVDPNAPIIPKRPRGRPRKIIDPAALTVRRPPGRPRHIFHPYAPPPEGTRRSPRKNIDADIRAPRERPENTIAGKPKFFGAGMSAEVSEEESDPDDAHSLPATSTAGHQPRKPTASQFPATLSNSNVAASSANPTSNSTIASHPSLSDDFLVKFLTGISLQKWIQPFRAAEFDENAIRTFGGLPAGAFGAFLCDHFPTMSSFDRFILEGAVRDYVFFFH